MKLTTFCSQVSMLLQDQRGCISIEQKQLAYNILIIVLQEQSVIPTSYILITEESTETVDTISKLLIRSKVKLPEQLRQMLAGRNQVLCIKCFRVVTWIFILKASNIV